MTPQRMRAILGGPLAKMTSLPITPKLLLRVGQCLVEALGEESKIYFAKRGWTGEDPMGGPPIWKSFSCRLRGKATVEITSTFYGMNEMARGDIPSRKMTWLTQEYKDQHPNKFDLTDAEKAQGMKRSGRVSQGTRLPLVIPLETAEGQVEFRQAPLTIGDAWVHPGIAKFTFFETALKKWRQRCTQLVLDEMLKSISGGQK